MQFHITRPVVIASEAGFKSLAPGLVLDLSEAEASQVKRQNAGTAVDADKKKKPKTSDNASA